MKHTTKTHHLLLWGLLSCALVFTGCKDSDFDFDEIDSVIGLGGEELTLPSDNSTTDITLDDALELNNSNFVKIAGNGDYMLDIVDGGLHEAHPSVNQIFIQNAITQGGSLPLSATGAKRKTRAGSSTFSIASFRFEDVSTPDGISDLQYVGGDFTLTLTLDVPGTVRQISTININMPGFMDIVAHTVDGREATMDANNTVTINNLTSGTHNVVIGARGIYMGINSANSSASFNRDTKRINMHGDITATATLNASDINTSAVVSGNLGSVNTTINVSDIIVTSAQGRFNPSIDFGNNLGSVTLNNVPDFLQGNNVNLNLYNPQIYIDFHNEMPIGGLVSGKLISYSETGNKMAEVEVPEFKVSKESGVVCISKQPMTFAGDTVNVVVPSLSSLVEKIPDNIQFTNIKAQGDDSETETLQLGHRYTVRSQYGIDCPLQFDEGASIVYRDSTDGWNDTMKDLSFKQDDLKDPTSIHGYLTVEIDVANKIPAYLTIAPIAMDVNGRTISSDLINIVVDKSVSPSQDGVTPVVTHVTMTVTPKNNDALHQMDGMKFEIIGASSDNNGQSPIVGKTINAYNQTLKISGIKVSKHGKVVGDF